MVNLHIALGVAKGIQGNAAEGFAAFDCVFAEDRCFGRCCGSWRCWGGLCWLDRRRGDGFFGLRRRSRHGDFEGHANAQIVGVHQIVAVGIVDFHMQIAIAQVFFGNITQVVAAFDFVKDKLGLFGLQGERGRGTTRSADVGADEQIVFGRWAGWLSREEGRADLLGSLWGEGIQIGAKPGKQG